MKPYVTKKSANGTIRRNLKHIGFFMKPSTKISDFHGNISNEAPRLTIRDYYEGTAVRLTKAEAQALFMFIGRNYFRWNNSKRTTRMVLIP